MSVKIVSAIWTHSSITNFNIIGLSYSSMIVETKKSFLLMNQIMYTLDEEVFFKPENSSQNMSSLGTLV